MSGNRFEVSFDLDKSNFLCWIVCVWLYIFWTKHKRSKKRELQSIHEWRGYFPGSKNVNLSSPTIAPGTPIFFLTGLRWDRKNPDDFYLAKEVARAPNKGRWDIMWLNCLFYSNCMLKVWKRFRKLRQFESNLQFQLYCNT